MQTVYTTFDECNTLEEFANWFRNYAYVLLKIERQHIEDAWNDGYYGLSAPENDSAEKYYTEKYGS